MEDAIKQDVLGMIGEFLFELRADVDFTPDRVSVWADIDKFNWKEDEYVWSQKKERTEMVFTIYIDSLYITTWSGSMTESQARMAFWKGFLQKYNMPDDSPNKLWLDKSIYDEKEKERQLLEKESKQQVIKDIESKKVTNETQAIAKEIALDVAKQPDS